MLRTLLETEKRRERQAAGAVTSVAVHVVLLAAMCGVSDVEATPRARWIREDTTIVYTPARMAPARDGRRVHRGVSTTAGPMMPQLPALPAPIDIPLGLPDPASALDVIGGQVTSSEILAGPGGAGDRPTAGGPWSDATVDELPRPMREILPRYPDPLRAAGIEGEVVAMFVIDSAGRVDVKSVRILRATDARFVASVVATLRDSRFAPGRVDGRAVATLVQRSFRFAIR